MTDIEKINQRLEELGEQQNEIVENINDDVKKKDSLEVQINLLQKQVDQVQLKVFDSKKSKWYKNPSLILSIIALASSLYFSVNAIREKTESKKAEKESAKIDLIKKSIQELLVEEEKFFQTTSNQSLNSNSINNASLNYQAKSAALIDKISINLNDSNLNIVEPNLLINYGRFLLMNARYEKAFSVFKKSADLANDSLTKQICYRSIANILANLSFAKADSLESRKYRLKDIAISESFSGNTRIESLARSYELWALDEYFLVGNKEIGNSLIDSAKFHLKSLPDFNLSKKATLNRLGETYNFYNEIIVFNNLAGEYKFQTSNGKTGKAFIQTNLNGVFINIDQTEFGRLIKRYNGQGSYVNLETLRFEVSILEIDAFNRPQNSGGSLILKGEKGEKLKGSFYEFGKKPTSFFLERIN